MAESKEYLRSCMETPAHEAIQDLGTLATDLTISSGARMLARIENAPTVLVLASPKDGLENIGSSELFNQRRMGIRSPVQHPRDVHSVRLKV